MIRSSHRRRSSCTIWLALHGKKNSFSTNESLYSRFMIRKQENCDFPSKYFLELHGEEVENHVSELIISFIRLIV